MKQIQLTKGQFALVDEEDFDYLNQWKWHACKYKTTFYARRTIRLKNGKKAQIHMHRLILELTDPSILCDHIDHNGLNNCRSNLRTANYSQSITNRNSHTDSISKYLGVTWDKNRGKWMVRICKDRNHFNLGRFDDEKDAAKCYNEKAIELHGEFANLNIIS